MMPTQLAVTQMLSEGAEPIAGYRLVRPLGQGSFGQVWMASAPGDVLVALKFVRTENGLADSEARVVRSLRDARHPHLLDIHFVSQFAGYVVIGMSLCDGSVWERYRERKAEGLPGIPDDELLHYMEQAARAIDYLNGIRSSWEPAGPSIRHGDVKPQNILLVGGSVKVADFGLTCVFENSIVIHSGVASPYYAAPESFDKRMTATSDQYSLAVTYCQLRHGHLPFQGTMAEIMKGHLLEEPNLAPLRNAERSIIARALSKTPAARWPSCREFVAALMSLPSAERTRANSPSPARVKFPAPFAPKSDESSEAAAATPAAEQVSWTPTTNRAERTSTSSSATSLQASAETTDEISVESIVEAGRADASEASPRESLGTASASVIPNDPIGEEVPAGSGDEPALQEAKEGDGGGEVAVRVRRRRRKCSVFGYKFRRPSRREQGIAAAVAVLIAVVAFAIRFTSNDSGTLRLELNADVATSAIRIDSKPIAASAKPDSKGVRTIRLGAGEHSVNILANGYWPESQSFAIRQGEETPVRVRLTPKNREAGASSTGGLKVANDKRASAVPTKEIQRSDIRPASLSALIEVFPPDATLALTSEGATLTGSGKSRTLTVAGTEPREATLAAWAPGYDAKQLSVRLSQQERGEAIALRLEPLPAVYSVVLDPPQAKLETSGSAATIVGDGPIRTVTAPNPDGIQFLSLTASMEGRETESLRLVPNPGAKNTFTFKLAPNPAVFTVDVDPPEASLTVDEGEATITGKGRGRMVRVPISEGKAITLVASHEGYYPERTPIIPRRGLNESASIRLRPLPPMPAGLNAPFTEDQAKAAQIAWGAYLQHEVVRTNSVGMKMVLIPPGAFDMGSGDSVEETAKFARESGEANAAPDAFEDEHPQHHVLIAKPFLLSMHEVTVGQFRRFVQARGYKTDAESNRLGGAGWNSATSTFEPQNPEYNWQNTGFAQTDDHPVVNVTYLDAVEFCRWLSETEKARYRLPTEAEWEYACRAGTTTRYICGDYSLELTSVANLADATAKAVWSKPNFEYHVAADGFAFTAPVGSFRANGFSLFDMQGNVREWCADWYQKDAYLKSSGEGHVSSSEGQYRVLRGGSWLNYPIRCRSAVRFRNLPVNADAVNGFRVACSLN